MFNTFLSLVSVFKSFEKHLVAFLLCLNYQKPLNLYFKFSIVFETFQQNLCNLIRIQKRLQKFPETSLNDLNALESLRNLIRFSETCLKAYESVLKAFLKFSRSVLILQIFVKASLRTSGSFFFKFKIESCFSPFR